MCNYIGIECLAANALIELFERQNKKEVSFDMLVHYGMQVVHILEEQTGEEIILLLSQKYQINMIENYSDLFDVIISANGNGLFRLKGKDKESTLSALKNRFRWTMSIRYINAFLSDSALKALGLVA